ncbi:Rha family transcriptional regulator [Salipaludibacillus agaradhaerens]|uniref:Rha family transcriptional regulator n=1 Tax=Salipaludibacillus TaxID=1884449 RepID=UPI0020D09B34|nr:MULTISPECIES: Rha family transcriptional regulator [Salipaludibacillus]MCR6116609.1 Rha family transcriptional regulator [Salipaludibacillus agaradhaerens]UTR13453.1 Rha family transcriptional regulator [Salipaludibacillus sp. LMS25]
MNQLVFIKNNQAVTDSLTVADVFNKRHDHVVRDIENQLSKLIEAGESEWGATNFGETRYQHRQNKQWYQKYNLTEDAFAIIAMSYVTPEAMKMKIKFLNEFKKMKEKLQTQKPKNQLEILQGTINQLVEQERRVSEVEKKLDNISDIMTMDSVEWRDKVNSVLKKIANKWSGVEPYRSVKKLSYDRLEKRAGCKLELRLNNRKERALAQGMTKSYIRKINKLDVIQEDKKLIEIYIQIIKEMAIQFNVNISDFEEVI